MKALIPFTFMSSLLISGSIAGTHLYSPRNCQFIKTTIQDGPLVNSIINGACAQGGQVDDSLLEFANRLARGLLDNRGKIGFAERRMICVGAEIWVGSIMDAKVFDVVKDKRVNQEYWCYPVTLDDTRGCGNGTPRCKDVSYY